MENKDLQNRRNESIPTFQGSMPALKRNGVPVYSQCKITPVNVIIGDSNIVVLPENDRRVYLLIQNNGVNPVYVSFGQKAKINGSLIIPSNGYYEPLICPIDSLQMISDTGVTNQCAILYGTVLSSSTLF